MKIQPTRNMVGGFNRYFFLRESKITMRIKKDTSNADSPGWTDIVSNVAKIWLQINGKKTNQLKHCVVLFV